MAIFPASYVVGYPAWVFMPKSNLKWRNRYSQEEGYVQSISQKKGCFINTFEKPKAKKYSSEKAIEKDIEFLKSIGEMTNNDFFAEEV